MKLDYLGSGSLDCPLVRLYDFTPGEAMKLHRAISRLAENVVDQIAVHEMRTVQAVEGCRLVFRVREWDHGIVRCGTPCDFECGFTRGTWDNVAGLVEPFAEGGGGFQWLAGAPGEASLLLSVDGKW